MPVQRVSPFLLLGAISCGPQLPPPGPEPLDLDLGAALMLRIGSISPGGAARLSASALFWPGDVTLERDSFPRGSLRQLAAGDRLWVNGVPLSLSIADWGPGYAAPEVPEAADGRYQFRLDIAGSTVTRSVLLRPVELGAPPEGVLRASAPVTLSWRPALPSAQGITVGLTSCVVAEPLRVSESSATLSVRLSALGDRCDSHAYLSFVAESPIGAPFHSGTMHSSVGASREVTVLP